MKNLPNKLTVLRILLIPLFIITFIFSYNNNFEINISYYYCDIYRFISAIIFLVASITDYFDGYLARKYNVVSNFGKLMDPLADKMIVITALILLTNTKEIHYLCTLIIVLREITISSIRLVALEQNVLISASKSGKIKTATQMIALVLILFDVHRLNYHLEVIVYAIFYFSFSFVIISFIDYIIKSRKVFLK